MAKTSAAKRDVRAPRGSIRSFLKAKSACLI